MKIVDLETVDDVAEYVAKRVIDAINNFIPTDNKKYLVLGLPTGSTPIPVYKKLVEAHKRGEISFKNVVTFNMDEYLGLDDNHIQSYHYFMYDNLFKYIDIPLSQVHILDGMANNPEKECENYEKLISEFGGIDIQLGGIGENGHLAFNEPGTAFDSVTHVQELTEDTINVNSRFFENISEVPTKALTIGLKTIFDAKEVIIMATGPKKSKAVKCASKERVSTDCPASMLQMHNNAYIVCDRSVVA